MRLIIFDLDQTLVDVISVHDQATEKLFQKWYGVSARLNEIDFAGKSQGDNLVELATRKGIPEEKVRGHLRQLLDDYERLFAEIIPHDASGFVLAGAKEILEALAKTDNLVVLYSGGSEGVVKATLAVTGLGRYFRFCLYGAEVKARADMVRQALARARQVTGREFKDKDIVIIGDSVRDIECGQEFNALTIALATGFHSKSELLTRKPDYLFDSLKDYTGVLQAISGQRLIAGTFRSRRANPNPS